MEDRALVGVGRGGIAAVVLDGHGGSDVAAAAAEIIRGALVSSLAEASGTTALELLVAAEADISALPSAKTQGCTATLLRATPTELQTAWLGDSGAVLCRRDSGGEGCCGGEGDPRVEALALTERLHTPSSNPDEVARVENAGGSVRRQPLYSTSCGRRTPTSHSS